MTVPTRLFADIAPDNAMIYAVIKVLIFISGHRTYRFWTVVDYQHVMVITKLRCCINPSIDLSCFGQFVMDSQAQKERLTGGEALAICARMTHRNTCSLVRPGRILSPCASVQSSPGLSAAAHSSRGRPARPAAGLFRRCIPSANVPEPSASSVPGPATPFPSSRPPFAPNHRFREIKTP